MDLKYIVYITVNLCNGKIYVGVHKTNPNKFDGYIGNGIYKQSMATQKVPFHCAVKKYGYNNFKRTTIAIFPNSKEGEEAAYKLEEQIVNKTFVKSKNVYNVALGGHGARRDYYESEKKRVYMFTLSGNFLRSFDCVRSAAEYLETDDLYTTIKGIRNNCLGTSKICNGFFWSYKKEFISYNNERWAKIAQYTLTGEFVRSYDSIAQAQIELNLNTIHQAINKKCNCGGFQWRYFSGDTSNISPYRKQKAKYTLMPIIMYDSKGNEIKTYSSVEKCILDFPHLDKHQIMRVLQKKIKSHLGYTFKYKEDKDIV